ncbi:MAG: endonuclease [Chitinophagaceae bacterium]|nr:endonuclease [Chitinophagaceae bacterium]
MALTSIEGDCYNREHSTPQSWFSSASPMVSDAHHIFPTDGKVNGMRNNYPYGEVTSATFTSLNGGKLGTGINNFGYTSTVFEPINEYKGDFARAALYMAVRYEDQIISQNWSNKGNGDDVFLSTADEPIAATRQLQIYDDWFIKLLYKWHTQDPVSQKEIDRNNVIYAQLITDGASTKKQGNRNPFIDHPEFVAAIWGSSCLSVLPVTIIDFTAQKNNNAALLNWK